MSTPIKLMHYSDNPIKLSVNNRLIQVHYTSSKSALDAVDRLDKSVTRGRFVSLMVTTRSYRQFIRNLHANMPDVFGIDGSLNIQGVCLRDSTIRHVDYPAAIPTMLDVSDEVVKDTMAECRRISKALRAEYFAKGGAVIPMDANGNIDTMKLYKDITPCEPLEYSLKEIHKEE